MAARDHNPTLFDKLIAGAQAMPLGEADAGRAAVDPGPSFYTVTQLERFNEVAVRNTVRRELAWLMNTTHMEATVNLGPYPHVRSSVLNYGMPDLTGRVYTSRAARDRSEQIRRCINDFEPRMDPARLSVEARLTGGRESALTFVIRGDVTSAVNAMPVQFVADVEIDTGQTVVHE